MRKSLLVLCVLTVLFTSAGAVSADTSQPAQFTIEATTTAYDSRLLDNGRTAFDLTADGTATGQFEGDLDFREWGVVDYQAVRGVNGGLIKITASDRSRVVISFAGQTDFVTVWGCYWVLYGTGRYAGAHGQGTYTGDAGFPSFTVVFTSGS